MVEAAGGVVVRPAAAGPEICVVHRPRYSDWTLPKGKLDPGETFEQAALREVREETGMTGELVEQLGEVRYWYQREGKKIPKLVTFFLFEYRSGDAADHDTEVEEVRWIALEDAASALSYKGERDMVQRALALRR